MKTLKDLKENQAFYFKGERHELYSRLHEIGYGKIAIKSYDGVVSLGNETDQVTEVASTDKIINDVFFVVSKLDKIVISAGLQLVSSRLEFHNDDKEKKDISYTFYYKKNDVKSNDTVFLYSFDGLSLDNLANKLKSELEKMKKL